MGLSKLALGYSYAQPESRVIKKKQACYSMQAAGGPNIDPLSEDFMLLSEI